jgi:hypothetical protein
MSTTGRRYTHHLPDTSTTPGNQNDLQSVNSQLTQSQQLPRLHTLSLTSNRA